jgi:aspartyl-tRNA(Asn)/glutamyl-tRNA(Gln) amidotransferase subunit C
MADLLTRADVERIAALASLELTEAEVAIFTRQLTEILEYARQVQQLDTTGVPPTSHVLAGQPLDRADEPRPSLDRATALSAAPDPAPDAGLFRVPRVIG